MSSPLDVKHTDVPITKITTEEQARNWVLQLIAEMQYYRQRCDQPLPDNSQVIQKQRDMWTFLEKHGKVIGALQTLMLCGMVSQRCYQELTQAALNTLIPSEIGRIDGV